MNRELFSKFEKGYEYTVTIPGGSSQGNTGTSSSNSSVTGGSTIQTNTDSSTNVSTNTNSSTSTTTSTGKSKTVANPTLSFVNTNNDKNTLSSGVEETVTFTLESTEEWYDLIEEINALQESTNVIVVEMKEETKIPADVLDTIKGKDKDIVLEMDNGICWKINGKNVENAQDVDLKVIMYTNNCKLILF